MFRTEFVEKIKTHFIVNNPPPPENRAVYEIIVKKIWYSQTDRRWQYGTCALHAG